MNIIYLIEITQSTDYEADCVDLLYITDKYIHAKDKCIEFANKLWNKRARNTKNFKEQLEKFIHDESNDISRSRDCGFDILSVREIALDINLCDWLKDK
jgi:hypothetical protein